MTTEPNLKMKLTLGYIFLFVVFSFSILYIVREVQNLNVSKDDLLIENTKVIQLGNIVSDLYATENTGRLALLSYNKTDAKRYHAQLDSLIFKINTLKANNVQDESLKNKFDTIVDLIRLKSLTFDQVRDVQAKYQNFNIYNAAQNKIKEIQSAVKENIVEIDTTVEKTSLWSRIRTSSSEQQKKQQERLQKENEKVVARQKNYLDSLNKETESVLSKARSTEEKLLRAYYAKEELLIARNKELTNQLRDVLSEVERIILQSSNNRYETSKNVIDNVSNNIAKIGIVISVIALIFGLIILRDLNKSARNKKELERLNKTMQELVKQKSFFMATISHDMVSPINSLMGFSALLQNTLKTPKQREYLKDIQQSTRYIKNMVDDLSLFSNLEYNKIKIKNGKFNFKDLLTNVYHNLENTAQRKKIDLNVSIDENLNQFFNSDAYRIQQILTNVISNAVKFTHKGSVTINAKRINNKVCITVADTGIGIEIANKSDLFVEFVQAHDTTESSYGGSGLGLNITKRLIDLLHGNISFESELGKGTTFFIEIPLKTYSEKSQTAEVKNVEYDNDKKLQHKKILVVDDDPLQLKLLEEIFSNKINKITTIENGKHVKELLQNEKYNLIITDMQMPHYSGIQVIKDIRSLPEYTDIPVIALTGKIDFDELEYQNLGFNLYMQKPLNINSLYNAIYKLLRIKNKKTMPNHAPTTEQKKGLIYEHFDLTDLSTLLEHDKVAMDEILQTFVRNAQQDLEKLQEAFAHNDLELVKNTAHKMLPMFRQLKMQQAVHDLLVLERNTESLSVAELEIQIKDTIEKVSGYLKELQKIEL